MVTPCSTGQKTAIKKRYFHHTEELLQGHPEFLDRRTPSLNARLDITATAVPQLAAAAATSAIAEWGRPVADITHLVVSTYSVAHMPGADTRVASILGLDPSVRTTMLYVNAPCSDSPRTWPRTTAAPVSSSSAPSSLS
jgi:3-oxoacyl-[acyl-carrier-protein] synthase III